MAASLNIYYNYYDKTIIHRKPSNQIRGWIGASFSAPFGGYFQFETKDQLIESESEKKMTKDETENTLLKIRINPRPMGSISQ